MKGMARKMGLYGCVCVALLYCRDVQAQPKCTNSNLVGAFGFNVSGINTANGGIQFAITGRFEADGKGTFSGTGTQSVAGNISQTPFSGSYTVQADCTGSALFIFANGAEANLTFVLVSNGNEILIIDSGQGTVETGIAKKQFIDS